MATIDHNAPRAHTGFAPIGGAFSAVIGRLVTWNDARVTRKALSKLSDRELDDIGLSRADLDTLR